MLETETLERAAQDGEMDYEKWPALLEPLLERLNQIVFEFPIPRTYPIVNSPQVLHSQHPTNHVEHADNPPAANGAQVPVTPVRPLPPVPAFNSSATSTSHIPESVPNSQAAPVLLSYPPPPPTNAHIDPIHTALLLLPEPTTHHSASSRASPIPRQILQNAPCLAEGRRQSGSRQQHGRHLSPPHAQPLPNSVIDASLLNGTSNGEQDGSGSGTGGGGILWDNNRERANGVDAGLGSDESLGGALLTPIPWLKDGQGMHDSGSTEASAGTEDSGDSEMLVVPDRENGAVTQGELIRQEQEAGVVPVSSSAGAQSRMMSGAHETRSDDVMADDEPEDSVPHARGPGMVGTVDMGLVGGRGVEVSIESGEQRLQEDKTGVVSDAQTVLEQGTPKDGEDEEMLVDAAGSADSGIDDAVSEDAVIGAGLDSDTVLVDADGKTAEQGGRGQSGEDTGPDAKA